MDDVKITKEDLLEKLKANRETHRATFELAIGVYQDKMTELLESLIERAKDGKVIPQRALYELPMPEDHTNEYDVAIEMLEHDTRKKFILNRREFARYFMDQWEWTESFTTNTVSYAAASAAR